MVGMLRLRREDLAVLPASLCMTGVGRVMLRAGSVRCHTRALKRRRIFNGLTARVKLVPFPIGAGYPGMDGDVTLIV